MTLNKDELQEEITKRHIYIPDNIKPTNEVLIKLLGDNYLKDHRDEISFGRSYIQGINNVMVCKHYKDEKKNFNKENDPLISDNWIAEKKENGFRCLVVYSPESGFEFYSRRVSVKNFLNNDFTDKILLVKDGLVRTPNNFINSFNYRFAIDCEILASTENLCYEGIEYSNVDDYLQAILGSLPERALNFQKNGGNLLFKVFDVLYFEKDPKEPQYLSFQYVKEEITDKESEWVEKHFSDYLDTSGFIKARKKAKKLYAYLCSLKNSLEYDVRKLPFYKRRRIRNSIVDFLRDNHLPFEHIETEDEYKITFADQLIREGNEGCFKGSTRVNMADGSYKKINQLKVGDEVISYNSNIKKLENKKVINVFDNGLKLLYNYISVSHGHNQYETISSNSNYYRRIICTNNHKFYDGNNYSEISNLGYCYELNPILDKFRKQALLGWVVSDGCMDKKGIMRLCQKIDHPYWRYTLDMFENYSSSKKLKGISGKGTKMGYLHILKRYCKDFINLKHDIGYKEAFKNMDAISWAYAFMGDGSTRKKQCCFSFHSMTTEDIDAAILSLNSLFGVNPYTKKDNRVKTGSGLEIILSTADSDKFCKSVGRYVHPSMRYKFGGRHIDEFISYKDVNYGIEKVNIHKHNLNSEKVYKNNCYSAFKKIRAWDIEVEDNHNYFVENVLVHNCILKNLYAPYISDLYSSRSHRAELKVKTSVAQLLSNDNLKEDFDCVVTGYTKPRSKRIDNMIGSLKCSVYVEDEDGETTLHEIANVSGISHEIKRDMTIIDNNGDISLNPEYIGKVISINGQSLSHKSLRFMHATLYKNTLNIKDKNAIDCTYTRSSLESMVLIRGK